jgi:hypothetical protein
LPIPKEGDNRSGAKAGLARIADNKKYLVAKRKGNKRREKVQTYMAIVYFVVPAGAAPGANNR